ncbi:unnamed protein product [Callosobruchus maculatus]|uniref:Uncharacterized protein n=1 Tax=Callosobruchus maculatus TaxID=64391 RepID=A0A653BX63_CALMS|nr:unnamed protein product [Callosobruchus maculatus]VEN40153.1 unnamed protein product [Callosobruchus maculatus]
MEGASQVKVSCQCPEFVILDPFAASEPESDNWEPGCDEPLNPLQRGFHKFARYYSGHGAPVAEQDQTTKIVETVICTIALGTPCQLLT